jgi:pyridoxamine 5'-phosphate oxidase
MQNIQDIRKDYKKESLRRKDLSKDPIQQFTKWFDQSAAANLPEYNAMSVATCVNNKPHTRIVLLKGLIEEKFRFFTNYGSNKGQQLVKNEQCALLFHWVELERTVRIEGKAIQIPEIESLEYFMSRPKASQIGAMASAQSEVIPSRSFLEEKFNAIQTVVKPDNWGGFDVIPESIEFWQGRPSRMHDRFLYSKQKDNAWSIDRLSP